MKTLLIVILLIGLSGCAGMGCLNPFTELTDCGGKHGIWP